MCGVLCVQVWTSTNGGASWTQVSAAAPWTPRDGLSWAYSNGVHVVYGGTQEGGFGQYYGDMWASTNDGATWLFLANSTAVGILSNTAIIFDAAGYLYLFGGETSSTGSDGYNWISVEGRSTVPVGSIAQLSAVLGLSSSTGSLVAASSSAGAAPLSSAAAVVLSSSTAGTPSTNAASFTAVANSWHMAVLAVLSASTLWL